MVFRVPVFSAILFLMCCIVACSNSESAGGNGENRNEEEPFAAPDGMVYIPSSGLNLFLGASTAGTPMKEYPKMRVDFTYDYAIDESEVTRGEFYKLLGRPAGVSVDDSFPVTSVTYFDAVLFANLHDAEPERKDSRKADGDFEGGLGHIESTEDCLVKDAGVAKGEPLDHAGDECAKEEYEPDDI